MANNNNITVSTPIARALLYYATEGFDKSNRITTNDLGGSVELMHAWTDTLNDLLDPAYQVWATMHDNMGNPTPNATPDKTVLYIKLRTLCDLIGEINGFKLLPENLESLIIGASFKSKDDDISQSMKDAQKAVADARKARDNATTAEELKTALARLEDCQNQVKTLKKRPGNRKAIYTQKAPATFRTDVELLMRNAVSNQAARPVEDIIREREERANRRKEAARARKAAKRESK